MHKSRLMLAVGGLTIAALTAQFALAAPPTADASDTPSRGKVTVAELSPQTEAAIDKALANLAKNQAADGCWNGEQWAGNYPVGATALSLIAFMTQGHFPGEKPYGQVMDKALDYLLKQNKSGDGYMGNDMYSHGLATLALSELWGMSDRDDDIQKALKASVRVILRAQNSSGGWRYHPRPSDADVSVTVMQTVALSSAKQAGILVPDTVIDRAAAYVKSCHDPATGGFGYQGPTQPGFPRSAAGTYALMICGMHQTKEAKAGVEYLLAQPKTIFTAPGHYYYAQYYSIQVMYQAGDEYYQKWYPQIRDVLLARQNKDGTWPIMDADAGGTVVGTAFSVIVLGAPYRFVPIYQR